MRKKFFLLLIGLLSVILFISLVRAHSEGSSSNKAFLLKNNKGLIKVSPENEAVKNRILSSYGKLPIYFIPNQGQVSKGVLFYAKTKGYTLWTTKEGFVFDSSIKERREDNKNFKAHSLKSSPVSIKRDVSRLIFLKSNPETTVSPVDITEHRVNYFIGKDSSKWKRDIPTTKAILYREVWRNIDLKVYGIENQIEYDWMVKPEGRVDDIQFEYRGVKSVKRDREGNLIVKTESGELKHKKPIAYQIIDGKRVEVDVEFKRVSKDRFGFKAGDFNKKHSLIIDPVLIYSTYLGGNHNDDVCGIAVDSSGCAYITGGTYSTDFPTQNPFQGSNAGGEDVFITKLSSSGDSLIYSTFLGGNRSDKGCGIAVDSSGCAYITGDTYSTDFPTQNPFQGSNAGDADVFATKLSSSGDSLIYSTFLGGNSRDYGFSMAVDSSGCAYITGYTCSTDFPTQNPYQGLYVGNRRDAFVTKFSSSGDSLIYSTYLGGNYNDEGCGIAVDSSGCAYITGDTYSTDFPTQNPFQGSNAGEYDGFITKLSSSGNSLIYSTYLGGASCDYGRGIAVDSSGCAYITGGTYSTDFPTQNPFQGSNAGGEDVFITKLSSSGDFLIYSTFLGGNREDNSYGIAVDSSGFAYITGYTYSTDFPTQNPYQGSYAGDADVFATKLSSSGDSLIYSTFLGGNDDDYGCDIAVDSSGCAYITGFTWSNDFPTQNPYQGSYVSSGDTFITKLGDSDSADVSVSKSVNNLNPYVNENIIFTIVVTNNGPNRATNVEISDILPSGLIFVSYTASKGTYNSGTGIWNLGALSNGSSQTLAITAKVIQSGSITNTASKTVQDQYDPDSSNDSSSVTLIAKSRPDFTNSQYNYKEVDRMVTGMGQTLTFTIYYKNTGGDATGVIISDALDSNLEIMDAGGGTISGNSITWNIGKVELDSGGTISFKVRVKGGTPVGTKIFNRVSIDSNETAPFNTNLIVVTVGH